MDRFLDVWVVALLFGGFRLAGLGGAAVLGAARYYLVFALLLAAALVLVVLLRDLLKRCCLAVCSIFNDTIKLDGLVFCWSLINTFKDLAPRQPVAAAAQYGSHVGGLPCFLRGAGAGNHCLRRALAAALAWWKCSTCCSASRAWM